MRVLVDECLPGFCCELRMAPSMCSCSPPTEPSVSGMRNGVGALTQSLMKLGRGEKTIMDLGAASDWFVAKLVDVIAERGITRHVFRP